MRVAFLTNKTTRASLPVLAKLAESQRLSLEHVFFYDAISNSSPLRAVHEIGLSRVVSKLLLVAMSQIRLTVNKFHAGVRPRSAYEYAKFYRLPLTVTEDLNRPEHICSLRELGIDVLVTCVCKNILRSELLQMAGLHCVNVHPSLLPKYRGPRPIFWMLYHGETEAGVTIHEMTAKIDEGQVLFQKSVPLDDSLSEAQLEANLFKLAADSIEDVLLNDSKSSPRLPAKSSYFSYPTAANRIELKRRLKRRKQVGPR